MNSVGTPQIVLKKFTLAKTVAMRSSLKHNTFSEQWLEVGPLWTEFTTGKLLRTHELNTS